MWPIIVSWGPFALRSAAVFSGLGALAAMLYMRSRREGRGLSLEDFWGLILALLLGLLAGGVGVYVVFYGAGPAANLERLLRSRVSGGSFFGVFWGAAAAGFLFCRHRGLSFAPVSDDLGTGAALGLAIMRMGCLLNGCCYGRPTSLPWGMVFTDPASRVQRDLIGVPLHPTQLYESAGAGLIFLVLHFAVLPRTDRRAVKPGTALLIFVTLYAALRFTEDFFRASDPGRLSLLGLTTGQLLAALTLVGAACFLLALRWDKIKNW